MIHLGCDLQTWAILTAVGSVTWWPVVILLSHVYGCTYGVTLAMLILSVPYVHIPQTVIDSVWRTMKRQMPVVYMETPDPLGAAPEVTLLLPHGFLSLEAIAVYTNWILDQKIRDSTVYVDTAVGYTLPGAAVVFKLFGLVSGILKHANIEKQMRAQTAVAAMPGGFGDAVAGSKQEQIVFLGTTSYWINQCKKHGYALRIFHVYNGSDMIIQSAWGIRTRARIAARYHIPLVLPTAINKVSSLTVRCVHYPPDLIPTVDTVQADLVRYTTIDRQSPLFPDPLKTYTILAAL